jgi:hypothetical protein
VGVSTKSLYRRHDPARRLDAGGPTINAMDIVAVVLGIATFAILLALVFGIERI